MVHTTLNLQYMVAVFTHSLPISTKYTVPATTLVNTADPKSCSGTIFKRGMIVSI